MTTDHQEELLPCPFCGGPAELIDPGFDKSRVRCENPGNLPWCVGGSVSATPEQWNTRSAPVAEPKCRCGHTKSQHQSFTDHDECEGCFGIDEPCCDFAAAVPQPEDKNEHIHGVGGSDQWVPAPVLPDEERLKEIRKRRESISPVPWLWEGDAEFVAHAPADIDYLLSLLSAPEKKN